MAALTDRIDHLKASGLLGQLVRFGITGGLSSVIYSLVYLPLTHFVFRGGRAVLAVPFAFAVAVVFGYVMHSRWSFRDHGSRDGGATQGAKFVAVQGVGLSINALVTWIGTVLFHLPAWAPLVPAIFLAAVITFALNRFWVFA
ncbi:GtrA family protein [Sphingomonas gellani]|uniref:GtrA family protein n=1 Tax=Sphingomonas gellani TaxID=1166340 RepID=UPI001FCD0F7B|nr:GtrA family protein [Sphingomonas gellani]